MKQLNKIKKIVIVFSLLMLTGCSTVKNDVEDLVAKEYENVGEKFTYEKGVCLRSNLLIEYKQFNRGDDVAIIDESDEYYFINDKDLMLAIKKEFVRTENEAPFNEYKGYTRSGSHLFKDVELNDAIETFSLNDEVDVLDEFAGVAYVKFGNEYGYMLPSNISDSEIIVYVAPKVQNTPSEGYSGGSGSSDGGGSSSDPGPAPAPGPSETSGDSDISIDDLAYENNEHKHKVVLLAGGVIQAKVLADNTTAHITEYSRDDEIFVTNKTDEYYEILVNGYKARIQTKYVRLNSEKPYEGFEAYSRSGTVLYEDFSCKGRIASLDLNDKIKIIDEVDGMYVVELDNGVVAYTQMNNISKEKIYVAPKVVAPIVEEAPSGGSSDSGSSSSPAPAPAPEWTDEAM